MLRSDFSRKAHTNFQNYSFGTQCVFSNTLTSNRRQFHIKIEVHIKSNFQSNVFYRRFEPFQRNKHKNKFILGV